MSGLQFFQTIMGKAFYEGTMPALVREIRRLNDNLEVLIKLQGGTPKSGQKESSDAEV